MHLLPGESTLKLRVKDGFGWVNSKLSESKMGSGESTLNWESKMVLGESTLNWESKIGSGESTLNWESKMGSDESTLNWVKDGFGWVNCKLRVKDGFGFQVLQCVVEDRSPLYSTWNVHCWIHKYKYRESFC